MRGPGEMRIKVWPAGPGASKADAYAELELAFYRKDPSVRHVRVALHLMMSSVHYVGDKMELSRFNLTKAQHDAVDFEFDMWFEPEL